VLLSYSRVIYLTGVKSMKQLRRMLWGVTAMAMMAIAVGCGGGNNDSLRFFAGTYTGSFAGTSSTGTEVSGRFTVTSDTSGNITGTLTSGGNQQNVTGTIDRGGNLRFTTAAGANVIVVDADVATIDNALIGTGTFSQTLNNVQNASSGRASVARVQTVNNPFAGTYTGTFTSTTGTSATGTLNLVADANGIVTGTLNQTGTNAINVTGVISPAGNLTVLAVGDRPGAPRIQYTVTLIGDGSLNNTTNLATVTGEFTTTQGGTTESRGNFTLNEQP
jgi:hypothetical protein